MKGAVIVDLSKGTHSLCLPEEGGGEKYIEVDYKRLTMEHIMQLYLPERFVRKGQGKAGNYVLQPVHPPLIVDPDTSSIKDLYQELLGQLNLVLDMNGNAGKEVRKKIEKDFPLDKLMESLVARRLSKSEEHLRSVMYALISLFNELLQSLNKAEDNASGFLASAVSTAALIKEVPELIYKEYEEWTEAAQNLLITVGELEKIEKEAQEAAKRESVDYEQFSHALADTDSEIAEAREFLSHPENGFLYAAERFLWGAGVDQDALKETMTEMAGMAQLYIDVCREKEDKQKKAAQVVLYERGYKQRFETMTQAEGLVKQLREQTQKLREYQKKHEERNKRNQEKGNPCISLPHEFGNEKLISKKEYEQAEEILQAPQWGPKPAGDRILGLLHGRDRLLQRVPALSQKTHSLLDEGEKRIEKVLEALNRIGGGSGSGNTNIIDIRSFLPTTNPSHERLTVLYELAICVGYELSRSKEFLATTSVNSILETIVYLSERIPEEYRFTVEETTELRGAISALIRDEKEFIQREKGESTDIIHERWEKTSQKWISYNTMKNPGGIKLAKRFWTLAESLMKEKFKITLQNIRSAYDAKRIGQEERSRKRKEEEEK